MLKLRVLFQAYRVARQHSYDRLTAWRFARLALYEHPSSVR